MKPFPDYLSGYRREILPELTTATVIGITVAVAGNILISLALNIQKLAHKRLDAEKAARNPAGNNTLAQSKSNGNTRLSSMEEDNEDDEGSDSIIPMNHSEPSTSSTNPSETQPLLLFPQSQPSNEYGSAPQKPKDSFLSRISPFQKKNKILKASAMPVDVVGGESILQRFPDNHKPSPTPTSSGASSQIEDGNESEYLQSKLWWLGFLLMNVGELGNFISYAWAPASVVAPLGTFALIANCFFSPLLLRERFRKRDLLGIIIAIIGAVTVVFSSNASDGRLNPDALIHAISQTPFIVYSCGFTVLSTKAVSTLLTMRWGEVFTSYITYPVILVLILTGVGQIRYLNRALMRFDSKIVIPIQFVLFNLSAIVGSAILYGDFKKATFHQMVTFLYGCAATFAGVFIIAWSSETKDDEFESDEDQEEDASVADDSTDVEQGNIPAGFGSLSRRRRATLVLPPGSRSNEMLRHKHSAVSIMGLSPAQPLLLVHTPPRELRDFHIRDGEGDSPMATPGSYRRRALSWFGDESFSGRPMDTMGRRTRESSIGGRVRVGVPGNADAPSHSLSRNTSDNHS
ncbi:hypothetical protein D9758_001204 [Tetrapyrgos nigripes]|uniref:DUF803-domain-containing protein n=1 Tax=Tetrapyrgos nigripes TaxID=182062 RepID=A0A8H5LUT1_9AGAR|nr:hypothetical protein D9758_001204 [Tetrapyrgos nigripes]